MTKKLHIEFRYFDRKTCSRCKATDKNVEKTVQELRKALQESGVSVIFKATKLPAKKLAQSNSILINGEDIENLVGKKSMRSTACFGCSKLVRGSCVCRAYTYRGKRYRYVPKAMIREAIRRAT
ncbi:DUF2703 domain-containing protein [Candidatus Micrarchaeota archaeon]|nr:DUF2703 domain-containing protein [Candidatus Micrarchaeota archaeon]